MAIRGKLSNFQALKKTIRALPLTLRHEIAGQAAPAMTTLTRAAYESGRSVYGEGRPAGVSGDPLTLYKTGAVSGALKFVANGTVLRCVLGPKYSRYLIRYGLLPNSGAAIPASWTRALDGIVSDAKVPLE
jgi:hypothetical protein